MQLFSNKCYPIEVISSLYHVIYVFIPWFFVFFLNLRHFSPLHKLVWVIFNHWGRLMQWLNSVIPWVFIYFPYYKPLYSMELPLAWWELQTESDFFFFPFDSWTQSIWTRGSGLWSSLCYGSQELSGRVEAVLWLRFLKVCGTNYLLEFHWKSQLMACSTDYEAHLSVCSGTLSGPVWKIECAFTTNLEKKKLIMLRENQ